MNPEEWIIKKEGYLIRLSKFLKYKTELSSFETRVLFLDKQYKGHDYPDETIPYVIAAQTKKPVSLIKHTILTIEAMMLYQYLTEG